MVVRTDNLIWPVAFPDGVATPPGTTGFVALAAGGVMAIDLQSGDERWAVAANARPLLVVGEQLVAQDLTESRSDAIALLLFDVATGEPGAVRLEPILLPDWVSVNDPDQGFAFDVHAVAREVVIDWRAESTYRGGAAAPAAIRARATRQAAGRARLSLETGRAVTETDPAAADSLQQSREQSVDEVTPDGTTFPYEEGARTPCVIGRQLFYIVEAARRSAGRGATLKAFNLDSGNLLWERVLGGASRGGPPARRM